MNIKKLYNKWRYYKAMADKRPVSVFAKNRPSLFLSNYLIHKERAAWLLTSGKSFTALELNMLYEMAERPQSLNLEAINESSVKAEFFEKREVFYA